MFETGYGVKTSIYWALITMTTVGYGDVSPDSTPGRLVAFFNDTATTEIYTYLAVMIISIIMEHNLSGVLGMHKTKYKHHFVIFGWTSLSDVVLAELLTEYRQIAVITEKQDDIIIIKRKGDAKNIFPIYGDPSKTDILEQANIREASVVVLCMDDDSKNLITALHIKELNPKARIIVRTERAELRKTMKIAGVTYVVTPDVMAGRLIASAAFEPEVANFIEDVTSATDVGGYDIRQYPISEKHAGTIGQLSKMLRDKTNTTLVGIAKKASLDGTKEERWEVYPNPEDKINVRAGNMVLLLGNEEQFKKVEDQLSAIQGR
jgi:voltage-gated potassium channel